MKIETQRLEDHQAKLTVEVEPQIFDDAKRRVARKIAGQAKIPGFRPGKAPYNVVERYAGKKYIEDEAIELLLEELFPKALDEAQIDPYEPGQLTAIPSREPLTFEFLIPLVAEATIPDYRALRLPYEPPIISDDEVEKVLNDLQRRHAIIEPVERPAQEGDQVSIRLSAIRKQVAEGENATLMPDRPQLMTIVKEGENPEEWPFPGFSRHLIGLSAGDEKAIGYTFPEDSTFEALRGAEAEYRVVIEQVKTRRLPELNDEFAQSLGEYETLDALRAEVRASLERQAREEYNAEYNEKILSNLLEDTTVRYPPQMLNRQIDVLVEELGERLARQRMDVDTYLKTRKMDMEAFRQEMKPSAENRIRRTMLIVEVARAEKIKITQGELEAATSFTLGQIKKMIPPEEAQKVFTDEYVSSLASNLHVDMLSRRTMVRLRAIASGEAQAETPAEPQAETLPQEAIPSPAPSE